MWLSRLAIYVLILCGCLAPCDREASPILVRLDFICVEHEKIFWSALLVYIVIMQLMSTSDDFDDI